MLAGLFSLDAVDKIRRSALEKVVVCNTIPIAPHKHIDKIVQLSIADLLAQAIDRIQANKSVSSLFKHNQPAAVVVTPATAPASTAATPAAKTAPAAAPAKSAKA